MRLRWVSGYKSTALAWFRDARLVGLGRLAGGLGHLTQLWISGDGFGCFLGVRVSSFGWWEEGRLVAAPAASLRPSAERNPLIRVKPRMNGAHGDGDSGAG